MKKISNLDWMENQIRLNKEISTDECKEKRD